MKKKKRNEEEITDESLESSVKRGKIINYIVLLLLILAVAGGGWMFVQHQMAQRFTTEKWIDQPQDRHMILQDLLNEHPMVGLSRQEVEELLGPGEERETFSGTLHGDQEGDLLVYSVGMATTNDGWLILRLKGDMVSGVVTDIT